MQIEISEKERIQLLIAIDLMMETHAHMKAPVPRSLTSAREKVAHRVTESGGTEQPNSRDANKP